MFKKTILSIASAAALLGAFSAPAYAASTFHLVVPLGARTQAQEPVEAITVTLAGAALPKATVNKAYSETLRPYLSVTGDASFDPMTARWSLAEGVLPAGLALDEATGAVAGTPTAKTTSPASFKVLAAYKGHGGQAVYTIEVGGEVLQMSSISSGENHSCGLTVGGGVKCWGRNNYGQLGVNSTITQSTTPVDVAGLTFGVASIIAGNAYTCALTTSGAAKCWGRNDYGQLGDNSGTNQRTPVDVVGLGSGVAGLSTGNRHACAVMASGVAKCWGSNVSGQLGDNSTTNRSTPVDVVGLGAGVSSISAGVSHTCAVTTSGAAKCWGYNGNGQLGDNSTTSRLMPVAVAGLGSGVSSISAGGSHTCAVTTSGAAKCWGYNLQGQLGNGSSTDRLTPVDVADLGSGVSSVSAGSSHTCAVTTSGAAKCWGYNDLGHLGNNSTTSSSRPVDVVGMASGVVSIDSGTSHTCAAMSTGSVKCWGYNGNGQLGDNSLTSRLAPVDVQGFQ